LNISLDKRLTAIDASLRDGGCCACQLTVDQNLAMAGKSEIQ
jgi:hypothetical protein